MSLIASHILSIATVEKWLPQRELAWGGAGFLLLVPIGIAWGALDGRTVDDEVVALKPIRFALSIGVYMLTASWMFGYVQPQRLASTPALAATGMMLVGSAVEFLLILVQAVRGRQSHFNTDTPADAAIYAAMGVFAVLFVGAVLPLAWEIARHPRGVVDPNMIVAIVAGLSLTFVAGGGTGALMSRASGHAVRPAGTSLPLLGWSLDGGDLRIPHFLGIHAMQALPLLAGIARWLQPRFSGLLFAAMTAGYIMAAAALLRAALRGGAPASPAAVTTQSD